KGVKNFDFDLLIDLDEERLVLLKKIEELRARRNVLSTEIPTSPKDKKDDLLKEAGEIKNILKELEEKFAEIENKFLKMFLLIPNIPSVKMPVGRGEEDNIIVKGWSKKNGEVINPSIEDNSFVDRKNIAYLDHLELGKIHDMIDVEKSAEVSGSRFAYLKKDAVLLQDAISTMMKKELQRRGFMPIIPPLLVRETALYGTSHFPEGLDQVYKIDNENVEEGQDLYLVGSSEPVNFSYFSNTTFNIEELPIKFYAQTPCFRSEVGSWGKDVRGIKRVHQFDKLEMNAISTPGNAENIFNEFLEINEWLLRNLELPYRVVNKCTGDSGYNASYFQYDLEVFRNATEEWMETMTATNTSDFQARRLNIKYKNGSETLYAYTLNDTGVAFGRILLALIEHHQDGHGNIIIPESLREFFGKDIIAKN
ncbi:MAG: serine--tRNA ligase, partial [Proteobacteria bacterium]|nr:serine--tRNA ligase [Pseudomonadota bacterium]